ncbi:hypothetical protein EV426DRAFT_601311 [Tirmania nivea]|nr:hypothetical protein EV426DRAFT_601311 [Tirmania nivea]
MIIQTTARYSSRPPLPVTLLELHAALHVAVAALQYIVWWRKPIDMVVMTPLSLPHRNFNMHEIQDLTNHQFLDCHWPKLLGSIPDTSSQIHSTVINASPRQPSHSPAHTPIASITQQHTPSQSFQNPPTREHDQLLAKSGDAQMLHNQEPDVFTARIQGWWHGLLEFEESGQFSKHYFTSQSTLGKEGSQQIAGISIPHNPFHGIVLAIVRLTLSWQRWPFKALLWFCTCLIYSFAHLAAWNWHFPTHIEKVAWHWCTAFTTANLAVLSLLGLLASLYRCLRLWGHQWREQPQKKSGQDRQQGQSMVQWLRGRVRWVLCVLADIVCSDFLLGVYRHGVRLTGVSIAIGVIPWLLARLYIFVEAVISIRSVQKGTYDTVKWTELIPHI